MSSKADKVYIVTSGDYSDYRIRAVFKDLASAKRYVIDTDHEWNKEHHPNWKWRRGGMLYTFGDPARNRHPRGLEWFGRVASPASRSTKSRPGHRSLMESDVWVSSS